jgi:hypothetical protein
VTLQAFIHSDFESVPAVLARGDRVVAVGGGLLLRPVGEEERRPNGSKPISSSIKNYFKLLLTPRPKVTFAFALNTAIARGLNLRPVRLLMYRIKHPEAAGIRKCPSCCADMKGGRHVNDVRRAEGQSHIRDARHFGGGPQRRGGSGGQRDEAPASRVRRDVHAHGIATKGGTLQSLFYL